VAQRAALPVKRPQSAAGSSAEAGAESSFLRTPPKARNKAVMGVSANPERVIQRPEECVGGGRGGKRKASASLEGEGPAAKRGRGRERGSRKASAFSGSLEGEGEGEEEGAASAGRGKGRGRGRGKASASSGSLDYEEPSASGRGRGRLMSRGKVGKLRKKHDKVVKGRVVGAREGVGGSGQNLGCRISEEIIEGGAHDEEMLQEVSTHLKSSKTATCGILSLPINLFRID
jgi:hypothetical protein